jgi:phosphonate transport system permease protein
MRLKAGAMASAEVLVSSGGAKFRQTVFDAVVFSYLAIFSVVAVVRPSEEQLLNLGENASLFGAFAVIGAILSVILQHKNIKTLGWMIYAPPHLKQRSQDELVAPMHKSLWGIQLILAVVVTTLVGFVMTKIDVLQLLEAERFWHAMRLFAELASPNLEILPKAVMKIIETIYIAFMATAIAVPVAFVLSFLMARNIMGNSRAGFGVYFALRTIFNVSRSIEPVLWAIIFSIWATFGPFAGMLALTVHSIASLAKQYSEYVESVEDGPIEGIESTGAGRLQTVWFAVVPQVVLPYISYTVYRWDTNVRMATILGFVGGGGIGTMLMEYQGQAKWPEVGCIILVIATVVWIMDTFSAHVRAAIK